MNRQDYQAVAGSIVAVSISSHKGIKKNNVKTGWLVENFGFQDDAHADSWHRQISLLGVESIQNIIDKGLKVKPGDFAENITTWGLKLWKMKIGTRLKLGFEAIVEITQIGKVYHERCAIFHQVGDCVMPRQGVFAKVLKGGAYVPVIES